MRLENRYAHNGVQTRHGSSKTLGRLHGFELIPKVVTGVRFVDGEEQTQQAA
jgi:hypothetical protein